MLTLVNKPGETTGYLYNNIILLPDLKVGGMLLGNCAYSRTGKLVGKLIDNTLYNDEGEIIAKGKKQVAVPIDEKMDKSIMKQVWDILGKATNHVGPWIETTKKWNAIKLEQFLSR